MKTTLFAATLLAISLTASPIFAQVNTTAKTKEKTEVKKVSKHVTTKTEGNEEMKENAAVKTSKVKHVTTKTEGNEEMKENAAVKTPKVKHLKHVKATKTETPSTK